MVIQYDAVKAYILNRLEADLSPGLTYHGLHHTLDVLDCTTELCQLEGVSPHETRLLLTAALFHDSGFTQASKNHEYWSCTIARQVLPRYGYSAHDIHQICGMIMATRIPQSPQTPLEKILCDADLDYLGRDDFFSIGETLFEELKGIGVVSTREDWNRIQVRFLESHGYFTTTNQQRRSTQKEAYLEALKKNI